MKRLRVAVVGAGHLGRIHARLLGALPDVELVAIADTVLAQAKKVAAEHGAQAFHDYRQILGMIDAAIVATPTITHHAVGLDLLRAGLHVFIEKPIAANTREADDLVAAADASGLVLQVGHVERYNPAFIAAAPYLGRPQYIEAARTSGYTFRSTDIGVVLDLMVHDIDLALALAQSDVARVEALGFSLLGKHEDMAQARLTFANGCVANLTASRASYVAQRRMQVFASGVFAALDFATPSARLVRPGEAIAQGRIDAECLSAGEKQSIRDNLFHDYLPTEGLTLRPTNAIQEELRDFTASIATGRRARVDGRQGSQAVAVAERVLNAIAEHRWNTEGGDRRGPLARPILGKLDTHRDAA